MAALTAGIGLVAASAGHPWRTASFAVFGLSSLLLFTASTLLHAVRAGPAVTDRLRRADHAAIFLLIAGSYTPIALVTLRASRPVLGWSLFAVVWVLATLGAVFKVAWFRAPRWLSTTLYLGLGWMAILAIGPIAQSMATGGLALLVGGGVLYSLGAVIYARRRPDPWPHRVGFHGLWHLFVLAGWGAHLAMMAAYVAPT